MCSFVSSSNVKITRYPNGKIKSKVYINNGLKQGWLFKFNENGKMIYKGFYRLGKKHFWHFHFAQNGRVIKKQFFKNGTAAGPVYLFYKSGRKKEIYYIRGGKKHGYHMRFYKSGRLKRKTYFKLGVRDYIDIGYDEQGRVNLEVKYKNGKGKGWEYKFYPNGVVKEKKQIINGKYLGWHVWYRPNGIIKAKQYNDSVSSNSGQGGSIRNNGSALDSGEGHNGSGSSRGNQNSGGGGLDGGGSGLTQKDYYRKDGYPVDLTNYTTRYWNDSMYKKYTYKTFFSYPPVKMRIDFKNVDYGLLAATLFYVTNRVKVKHGAKPLKYSRTLRMAGFMHCRDMSKNGFYKHESPLPGKYEPWHRARIFGRLIGLCSENLTKQMIKYYSYRTIAEWLVLRWMRSKGHRENIISTKWHRVMGVAIYFDNYFVYGCQMFALGVKGE